MKILFFMKNRLCRFSFYYDMKYKVLVRWRRGWHRYPIPPLRLWRWWHITRGLFREATAAGIKTPWTFHCKWAFPMKIIVFRYNAGIVTNLSIVTMIAAAPDGVPPPADGWIKKIPAHHASERHWCGSPSYKVRFSWIRCEPNRFMPVSIELKKLKKL